MTWKPAATRSGTIFDHRRLVSGKPCTRTSGLPSPCTSTSSSTPLESTFIVALASVCVLAVHCREEFLATRSDRNFFAPATTEFDDPLEDPALRKHLFRRFEHADNLHRGAERVGGLARRRHERERDLVLRV